MARKAMHLSLAAVQHGGQPMLEGGNMSGGGVWDLDILDSEARAASFLVVVVYLELIFRLLVSSPRLREGVD